MDDEEDSKSWNREGECRREGTVEKNWKGRERERESERGKTFSLVLVAILLGASTVVATRCVHRADERLVKEHGKALLNHSRRRASLRPCYFGYHDTDTLFHQISLRAYINFPLTSLASSWWRTYGKSGIRRPRYGMYDIRYTTVRRLHENWSFGAFIHRSVNQYIQIFKNNLHERLVANPISFVLFARYIAGRTITRMNFWFTLQARSTEGMVTLLLRKPSRRPR